MPCAKLAWAFRTFHVQFFVLITVWLLLIYGVCFANWCIFHADRFALRCLTVFRVGVFCKANQFAARPVSALLFFLVNRCAHCWIKRLCFFWGGLPALIFVDYRGHQEGSPEPPDKSRNRNLIDLLHRDYELFCNFCLLLFEIWLLTCFCRLRGCEQPAAAPTSERWTSPNDPEG